MNKKVLVNLEEFENLKNKVSEVSIELNRLIGIMLMPNEKINKEILTKAHVREMVCDYFNLPWDKISGKKRNREYAAARFTYMWVCRTVLGASLTSIGNDLDRDHTSVIHGLQSVRNLMDTKDELMTNAINNIRERIII